VVCHAGMLLGEGGGDDGGGGAEARQAPEIA